MGFEAFAIVELMGHSQIAGKVTEEAVFGTALLRVDVPDTDSEKGFTKYYSASAVYAITPTDEATAKYAATQFKARAIQPWILPTPQSPMLASRISDNDVQAREDLDDDYSDDYDPNRRLSMSDF